MSSTRVKDRRASTRVAGSYPVQMWDARGRVIGRGRTGNLSENGVFVLLPGGRRVAADSLVQVEMELPRSPDKPRLRRRVRYTARVIRTEAMGQWRGVGLELIAKLT